MLKIVLKKMNRGYKILIDNKNNKISYKKKLKLKPSVLIGYIFLDKNNNFIFALDFCQLNYWLSLGVQFSKSFLRFIFFLNKYLLSNKYI